VRTYFPPPLPSFPFPACHSIHPTRLPVAYKASSSRKPRGAGEGMMQQHRAMLSKHTFVFIYSFPASPLPSLPTQRAKQPARACLAQFIFMHLRHFPSSSLPAGVT